MKSILFVLLLLVGPSAIGQAPPRESPEDAARGSLWQRLTPDQRALLWRSLTPEQKADVWRNLGPDERRSARDRFAPGGANEPEAAGRPPMRHRGLERGDGSPHMMSPEERQRMREQIREAHRLRRERFEADRSRRRERN